MQINKNLLEQFNTEDTYLIVSGWPKSGKGSYHGDSAFTKEVLYELVRTNKMRFVVVSEKNYPEDKPRLEADGNILILPVIDHYKFHLYPTILTWLNKFPQINHVTVHSNFTFSGIRHFVLLIPFLALIKAANKKVVLFAHNVLDDINFVALQLNVTNQLLVSFYNFALKIYNKFLIAICDKVVVLDNSGKEILSKYGPSNKLVYYPHFVLPRKQNWSKTTARQDLKIKKNAKVIMSFGFISFYKGSDKLAKLFSNVTKGKQKYQLIFAGGRMPSMKNKWYYQKYYQDFKKFCKKNKNIRLTGFLPEDELAKYFASADFIILPYRGIMGGSGAMGYAIGFGKPFMLSSPMVKFWENPEIEDVLRKLKVDKKEFTFEPTEAGMKFVLNTVADSDKLEQGTLLTKEILAKRHISKVTKEMYQNIYARKSNQFNPVVLARYAWKTITTLI